MTLTDIISAPHTTYMKTVDDEWYSCGIVHYGISGETSIIVEREPQKLDLEGISKIVSDRTKTFYILDDGTVYASGHDTSDDMGIAKGFFGYHMEKHPLTNVKDIYPMVNYSSNGFNTRYTIFRTKDDEYLAAGVFDGHIYALPQRFNLEEYLDKTKIMFPVLQDSGLYKIYNAPTGLPENIIQVSSNEDYTYFLDSYGQVYATGKSYASSFGITLVHDKELTVDLVQIPLLNVKSVKVGSEHTLFLTHTGELYGCGSNMDGQLGLGKDVERTSELTLIDSNVQFIEAGTYCSFYTNTSGEIKFMGNNAYQKFGMKDLSKDEVVYAPMVHPSLTFITRCIDFELPVKRKIDFPYKGIFHRIIIEYKKIDDDKVKISSYLHTPSIGSLKQLFEDYTFQFATNTKEEVYNNMSIVSINRIEEIKQYIIEHTNYYETPEYTTKTIIELSNGSLIEVEGEKTKEEAIEISKNYVYTKYKTLYDNTSYYPPTFPDNLVLGDPLWKPNGSPKYFLSELNKAKYNYY